MAARLFWFLIAGLYYFPCVLYVPIIELDLGFMIEDGTMRLLLSLIFWGVLVFFDGEGTPNAPVGGY